MGEISLLTLRGFGLAASGSSEGPGRISDSGKQPGAGESEGLGLQAVCVVWKQGCIVN